MTKRNKLKPMKRNKLKSMNVLAYMLAEIEELSEEYKPSANDMEDRLCKINAFAAAAQNALDDLF